MKFLFLASEGGVKRAYSIYETGQKPTINRVQYAIKKSGSDVCRTDCRII